MAARLWTPPRSRKGWGLRLCAYAGWVKDEGAVIVPELREIAPWHERAPTRDATPGAC